MAWAALGKKLATGAVKGKAKKIATDKLLNRKKKTNKRCSFNNIKMAICEWIKRTRIKRLFNISFISHFAAFK